MSAEAKLCLMLHAHLPFVRHPEQEDFLEEDWLYEAITECYAPLAMKLGELHEEGVDFAIGMSMSPTLIAMLDDALLRRRYRRHLQRLLELARREVGLHPGGDARARSARYHLERLTLVHEFLDRHQGDLLIPLRELQNAGRVEFLACNGTHALLPLASDPSAWRAQIRAGFTAHVRAFGRRPRGMWLAECGYDLGIDRVLAEEGVEYTFVDAPSFEHALPAPPAGLYAPLKTPAGVAVLARDRETAVQVWSAEHGYPGDGAYQEFHRDLGYDADYDYIRPYLHADGVRRPLGIKYHRVTDRRVPLSEKEPYDPDVAMARATEHARAFAADRGRQAESLARALGKAPTITACFDAELFGHWWHEGPVFLQAVLREIGGAGRLRAQAPSTAIAAAGPLSAVTLAPGTWGVDGNNKVWLVPENAWLYRYQHWAEGEMRALARAGAGRGGLLERAVRQAGRELLLLQSSDWAFMLAAGTNPSYAARRFKEHLLAFRRLRDDIVEDRIRETELAAREARAPLFEYLDLTAWA